MLATKKRTMGTSTSSGRAERLAKLILVYTHRYYTHHTCSIDPGRLFRYFLFLTLVQRPSVRPSRALHGIVLGGGFLLARGAGAVVLVHVEDGLEERHVVQGGHHLVGRVQAAVPKVRGDRGVRVVLKQEGLRACSGKNKKRSESVRRWKRLSLLASVCLSVFFTHQLENA